MSLIGTRMVSDGKTARQIFEEVMANPARRKFGFGSKLAIVNVDFQQAYTAIDKFATAYETDPRQIEYANTISHLARARGMPVIWTRVAYKADAGDAGVWGTRTDTPDSLQNIKYDSERHRYDPRVEIGPDDLQYTKRMPSAFFETPLASYLVWHKVDTVVVTGGLPRTKRSRGGEASSMRPVQATRPVMFLPTMRSTKTWQLLAGPRRPLFCVLVQPLPRMIMKPEVISCPWPLTRPNTNMPSLLVSKLLPAAMRKSTSVCPSAGVTLQSTSTTGEPAAPVTAWDALDAISAAIPQEIQHDARRLTIEIDDESREGRIELQGLVASLAERDTIAANFEAHPCFDEIKPGPTSPGPNNTGLNYRLEATVHCPGDEPIVAPDERRSSRSRN